MKFLHFFLISFFLSAPAFSATGDLLLQTENFPPYNYAVSEKNFAKGDGVAGISADIVREAFKRAGVSYTITLRFPWKRVYKSALKKPGYGVFSMVRSEERESLFHWVGPLAPDEWVFFAKKNANISMQSLEQAKAFKIGGYKGDALSDYLIEQGFALSLSSQDSRNVKKLKEGQIDLWASNNYSARALAKKEGVDFTEFEPVFTIDQVDLYLGLNLETNPAVVERLQSAIDQMRGNGAIDDIIARYIK